LVSCSAPYKYTYLLAYSPSQNSQCAAISRPQNKQINSSVWSLRATAVTRRYPHFAAERRCPPLAIYVCCRRRRSAANQPAALLLSIDGTDRQTDGLTPRPLHRPCWAYYAAAVSKLLCCGWCASVLRRWAATRATTCRTTSSRRGPTTRRDLTASPTRASRTASPATTTATPVSITPHDVSLHLVRSGGLTFCCCFFIF